MTPSAAATSSMLSTRPGTSVTFHQDSEDPRPATSMSSGAASMAPTRPQTSATATPGSSRTGTSASGAKRGSQQFQSVQPSHERRGTDVSQSARRGSSAVSDSQPKLDFKSMPNFERMASDVSNEGALHPLDSESEEEGWDDGAEEDAEAIAAAAERVPRRPGIKDLVHELGWVHTPVPLPPGARGDQLVPAPPAPRNWEEVTKWQRMMRGRIVAAMQRWDERVAKETVAAWHEIAGELKEAKVLETRIEGVFVHVFDYVVEFSFYKWSEYSAKMLQMRRSTKKLATWMTKCAFSLAHSSRLPLCCVASSVLLCGFFRFARPHLVFKLCPAGLQKT